jgi:hypothetical protein
MRVLSAFLVVGLFLLPFAHAGDEGAAGNWKVVLFQDGQQISYWLVLLENKGGKLSGTVEPVGKVPPTAVTDAKIAGDFLRFTLRVENGPTFTFEGKLPKAGGKKMLGSLAQGASVIPAVLEATTARNAFELEREILVRTPNDPRVFATVVNLIAKAKGNKVPTKDVQEWVDTAMRTAENFGPRWQQEVSVQLVEALVKKSGYSEAAVETARRALTLMDAQAPQEARLRVLTGLATGLQQIGQAAQAAEVEARMEKIEPLAHAEHEARFPDFKVAKFAGRKAKSNRAVLIELFTGAQCPPCVAADLAFDAMPRAYDATEVVLLEYHLHIPGPDALTNADAEARAAYYTDDKINGTPSVLFSGGVAPVGGGGREDSEEIFDKYRSLTDPLLESPAGAQLQASAVRKGDKVFVKASVQDLGKPGPKVKLRIALVEDWARYRGRNGLSYYHNVVRAFPGGVAGLALAKKDTEQAVVVDLGDLRKELHKYLDTAAKESPFLDSQRPMRFRNLSVVAFVQNDATQEVLQAVQVPVKEE